MAKQWTHTEQREQAAAFALGALAGNDRIDFEAHVLSCAECEDDVRSFGQVVTALACAAAPVEPGADVRRRTLAAVRTPSTLRPAPQRSLFVPWLAAAASLAIAIGVGAYTVVQRHHASEA